MVTMVRVTGTVRYAKSSGTDLVVLFFVLTWDADNFMLLHSFFFWGSVWKGIGNQQDWIGGLGFGFGFGFGSGSGLNDDASNFLQHTVAPSSLETSTNLTTAHDLFVWA